MTASSAGRSGGPGGTMRSGASARSWADKLLAVSPLAAQAAKHAVLSRQGYPLEVALATRYEPIEAYALAQSDSSRDFGHEAIAMLLKLMDTSILQLEAENGGTCGSGPWTFGTNSVVYSR